jgi:hypothetical protein
MDRTDLVRALRCNGDGIPEDETGLGCGDKFCKYRDVDGACDVVGMCHDAADEIARLTAELADMTAERDTLRKTVLSCIDNARINMEAIVADRDAWKARADEATEWADLFFKRVPTAEIWKSVRDGYSKWRGPVGQEGNNDHHDNP